MGFVQKYNRDKSYVFMLGTWIPWLDLYSAIFFTTWHIVHSYS